MKQRKHQIKKHLWAMPKQEDLWLVFDLNNGSPNSGMGYVWWFNTKYEALEHRRHVAKMKYTVDLSMPIKYKKV